MLDFLPNAKVVFPMSPGLYLTFVETVFALSLAGPSANGCHLAQPAFSGFVPNTVLSFLSRGNRVFASAF